MFKALESIPLFKDLDIAILKRLEALFEPFDCPANSIIFEQGDRAEYIYLILEGTVEVRYKPYDGPPIVITTLATGSIFGWSAAIGNAAYTSGAVCKVSCRTIRMRGQELHRFCWQEPEAGYLVLELLAEAVSSRWSNAKEQIHSLLNTSVSRGTISARGKENG
jgi:CRP-like cAMP-binding protein